MYMYKPCDHKDTIPINWRRLPVIDGRTAERWFDVLSLLKHSSWLKSTRREVIYFKQTKYRDTAGQFLQTVVLQVETTEAAEILKKTCWKCSQPVALQVKLDQVAEISKDLRWKSFQLIPCHVEFPEAFQTVKTVFIESRQTIVG